MKFYKCAKCGNVAVKHVDSGAPMSCCGEVMAEMTAGSTDAATEKHVPVAKRQGTTLNVEVGSVLHPMLPEHSIMFIAVEQNAAVQVKYLDPGAEPKAEFCIKDAEPCTVYEYCNLHGLWKAEA